MYALNMLVSCSLMWFIVVEGLGWKYDQQRGIVFPIARARQEDDAARVDVTLLDNVMGIAAFLESTIPAEDCERRA